MSLSSCDGTLVEGVLDSITIRQSRPGDLAQIEPIYRDAFPEEDLLPLVRALLAEPHGILSLVGHIGASLAGHILFTTCSLAEEVDVLPGTLALLGPLAVAPAWQRQGVGGALARDGMQRLEQAGATQFLVLGDPAYYGRLGFLPETGIAPAYPLPDEWRGAWQSIRTTRAAQSREGTLSVPAPWRVPALWAP